MTTSRTLIVELAFAIAVTSIAGTHAAADPVDIEVGGRHGAGYTFRRGSSCMVLTAAHVIEDSIGDIVVRDRSGATATADEKFQSSEFDVSLLELEGNSQIACASTWPDSSWLGATRMSSKSEFEVIRHYPNGRETLVLLRYAGGNTRYLTLGPVDKSRVRESDSGSIVMHGTEIAGIVQKVDPANDRVEVLRIDVIDQLLGNRFRDLNVAGAMSFAGVFRNGRLHPNWSTFVQSWLLDTAGRTIVAAGDPSARCTMRVDVVGWDRVQEPNSKYAGVQNQLTACGKKGFIWEQMCASARRAASTTPRTITVHKLVLNLEMARPASATTAKLFTGNYAPPASLGRSGPQLEMAVLQSAVAEAAGEMFDAGACN